MSKTIDIGCSWAHGCGHGSDTIAVDTFEDFVEELEKFFEEMCGMGGVDSFYTSGGEEAEYEWSNDDLPRNEDLSDVWSSVKEDLKTFFDAF